MLKKKDKRSIGRIDIIDLPDLGLEDIHVKIDTGAFSSAIHCHHIEIVERNGKEVLHFELLDPEHPKFHNKPFEVENFQLRNVKNSGGVIEERFLIETNIRIFNKEINTQFTLTDRGNMKFPILLGKLLRKHFLVDVTRTNLSYKLKQKQKI